MPVSSSRGTAPQPVQAAVTQDSTVHGPATVITSWPGGSGSPGSGGCPQVSGGGWSLIIAGFPSGAGAAGSRQGERGRCGLRPGRPADEQEADVEGAVRLRPDDPEGAIPADTA